MERSRRTLEVCLQTRGEMHLRGDLFDVVDRRSQRGVGSQVEGHCYGRELTLVINGQRLGGGGGLRERVEWNGTRAGAGGGGVGGCARDGAPIDGRRALDAGHAADGAGGSGEHAGGGRVLRR